RGCLAFVVRGYYPVERHDAMAHRHADPRLVHVRVELERVHHRLLEIRVGLHVGEWVARIIPTSARRQGDRTRTDCGDGTRSRMSCRNGVARRARSSDTTWNAACTATCHAGTRSSNVDMA